MFQLSVFLLGLSCAWLVVAWWLDHRGRRPLVRGTFDAIVVAGAGVREDGMASAALHRRVLLATKLWREGRAPCILLTGGEGRFAPAEALAAEKICLELGVPGSSLRVETRSRDTRGNAMGASRILGAGAVVVVTDGYHRYRCERMFRRHFSRVESAGTQPPTPTRIRMALREALSVLSHAVRGHL